MNNPFDKVSMLSSGIRMLDEKGAPLPKESKPINRDTTQMTLNEYVIMKNSEGGLSQQASQSYLNSPNNLNATSGKEPSIADNLFFARLKPDSAVQIDKEIYIGGNDDRRMFGRNQSH